MDEAATPDLLHAVGERIAPRRREGKLFARTCGGPCRALRQDRDVVEGDDLDAGKAEAAAKAAPRRSRTAMTTRAP